MELIRHLTQKDTPWTWSSEQDQAFTSVQRLVTEAPVLCYYDPSLNLKKKCGASQSGLGDTSEWQAHRVCKSCPH